MQLEQAIRLLSFFRFQCGERRQQEKPAEWYRAYRLSTLCV